MQVLDKFLEERRQIDEIYKKSEEEYFKEFTNRELPQTKDYAEARKCQSIMRKLMPLIDASPDKAIIYSAISGGNDQSVLEERLKQAWEKLPSEQVVKNKQAWEAFAPKYLLFCENFKKRLRQFSYPRWNYSGTPSWRGRPSVRPALGGFNFRYSLISLMRKSGLGCV